MLKLGRKYVFARIGQPSVRTLIGDTNLRESPSQKRMRDEITRDKQDLKWRKTNEEAGEINTKLKVFANNEQTSDFIIMMQKPISLNPKEWLSMWEKRKEDKERLLQQFIPMRHDMLGADLATAHFILYRGGAVKFTDSKIWMKADKNSEFNLPSIYNAKYKIEGIKCDNMNLYYEGLENIQWLLELKFLSFRNVKTFDDWCLDRVSSSQCPKLEVLDISGTKCSLRGFSCLYRLNSLQLLIVDNSKSTVEYELALSMLQEALPNLKIADAASIHD